MTVEKIGVLGIGKLGLCLALNLEKAGYTVIGVDIHPDYVNALNNKTFNSPEPSVNEYLQNAKNFKATTEIQLVIEEDIDLLFIEVATPSTSEWGYDHTQVEKVVEQLIQFGKRKKEGHLVIGCTTMPGYTSQLAERLKPFNYTVSYNPEFIAQGSIMRDMVQPDQVLIGEANEAAGDEIQAVYEKMCHNQPAFHRMDALSAEICKLATNCFLTTKIAFANAVGDLASQVGAQPEKILAAIGSDSRIGNKYLRYGFGFGGPCFPRDNRALGQFATSQNFDLLISKATDTANHQHLEFQFQQYLEEYPADAVIEFDYVTYKKGSVLLEESQQLALAKKLAEAGRKVLIKDRMEVVEVLQQRYPGLFIYK